MCAESQESARHICERRVLVMLCAYGDESADETKQRVFAVGAVIGSEQQWQAIQGAWVDRTGGMPFHANDCDSDRGAYANIPHNDNKKLYSDLIGLLADSGLGGWTTVIDLIAQREIFPDAMDISYYRAFADIVERMKCCAHFHNDAVRFTFDMREESAYNTLLLFKMLQAIPEWQQFMEGGLTFEFARNNPRLQIADLFVREVMKAWDNRVAPTKRAMRKSWARLRETERFHGEVFGLEWWVGLKERLPELEKRLGMSMQSYAIWLREKGLEADNMSNRLLYLDYIDKQEKN